MNDSTNSRVVRWTFVFVVLLTIVVRLLAAKLLPTNLSRDDDSYRFIARQVALFGEFSREIPKSWRSPPLTAYRPPLYPLVLGAVAKVDPTIDGGPSNRGVLLLNIVLSAITALAVTDTAMGLARLRWPDRPVWPAGCLAGVLVAIDPLLVHNATLAMTETMAAAISAVVLWMAARWLARPSPAMALWLGLMLGSGALTRPIYLPWSVLLVAAWFWFTAVRPSKDGQPPKGHGWSWLAMAVAIAAMICPWVIRNIVVMHKPIATTTHGGYTLMLGNNPFFYRHLKENGWFAPWDDLEFQSNWRKERAQFEHVDSAAELREDQLAKELAMRAIRNDPYAFANACGYRLFQLWNPLPNRTTESESTKRMAARWIVGGWNIALYLAVFLGVRTLWWSTSNADASAKDANTALKRWLLIVATLAFVLSAVHTIYWSNLRMRVPIVPALCVLASLGVWSRRVTT